MSKKYLSPATLASLIAFSPKHLRVAILPFAALLSITPAYSQGIITGSISGTATDASGAVVPGATVTIADIQRGTKFNTVSRSDGNFAFQALPIGSYNLTITSPGFAATQVNNVSVTSGNEDAIGRQVLSVSGSTTTVEVRGDNSAQLETTESQVSGTFAAEALESLPLGNGFDAVALLVPGVVQTHDLNFSNTNGAGFSSNGSRGRANNFELDGQSNNDNSVGGPQLFFGNEDAIAEVQVIQSNFSAQYGRNTGSIVNYITKSGTNAFHGSAFELYTGSFLSSYPNQDKTSILGYCASGQTANCTPVARLPRSVDNKYGGTIGGPILKDKLFFFGSTYFAHTRNGTQPFTSSNSQLTPTPVGLATLEAAYPNNPGVLILKSAGPYGVTLGNPKPILSSAQIKQIKIGTDPAIGVQVAPVTRTAPSGNYGDQEDLGRLDYQATPKDRFYLRYLYQKTLNSNSPAGGAAGTFYDVPGATHSVGADLTHTFSAAWLNQLRYSFQQSKIDFQAGSFSSCTVNTLTACPGYISFSGTDLSFGEASNLPQGRTVKVTQVQDNVSFTKGKQTILFGGEYDRQNSPNVYLPNYNGTGTFGDLNSFLNQSGTFSLATGNPVLAFIENDYAFYVQDDLKINNSLTLNVGLRWEFFGQAINLLHQETVTRESNPATAIWDKTLPVSQRTDPSVKNAYKNFEPRLGFAFNPTFDKKLVIRGGFSIGYDPAFYNIFLNAGTLAPVATSSTFACAGTCLGSGDFTGAGLRTTNLSRLPLGGNPALSDQGYVPSNFHNPYLETYSFGVEHQVGNHVVGTVRYVGSHGVGLFQTLDGNPDLGAAQAAFPASVPTALCQTAGAPGTSPNGFGVPTNHVNCNLGNQSLVANTGFSIYNSLQTEMSLSNFHGLSGNVSYTFSHATDNTSEVFATGAGGNTNSVAQNPLNTDQAERGTSGFSLPNNFSLGMTYALPNLTVGNSLVHRVSDGFRVNAIYQFSSGQPFNPFQYSQLYYGNDPSYCDNSFAVSAVGTSIDSCRLVLSNKNAPLQSVGILQNGAFTDLGSGGASSPSAVHWIVNNTDIANQLNNPFPGSGRNILRAQTFNNLDASIFKDTKINDRVLVELQLSAYNALNRQFRGTPVANAFQDNGAVGPTNTFLSNASNSSLSNQGIGNRNVQLGAKIKF
jgi:hypothetical protein